MNHPQSRFASQLSGPCNQGRPAAAYSCATVVASSPTDASGVRYTARPVNGSIPTLVHRSRKRPSACARKAVSDILVVAETRGERMRIGLISSVRGSALLRPLHGQLPSARGARCSTRTYGAGYRPRVGIGFTPQASWAPPWLRHPDRAPWPGRSGRPDPGRAGRRPA